MAADPAEKYVKIYGGIRIVAGDGPDPDQFPDDVAPDPGRGARLRLRPLQVSANEIEPAGKMRLGADLVFPLDDQGDLYTPEEFNPDGSVVQSAYAHAWALNLSWDGLRAPIPAGDGTYEVIWENIYHRGARVEIESFPIAPVPGTSGNNIKDLSPVNPGRGVPFTVGDQGASIADRRLDGADVIFVLDNGVELPPVPIPAIEQVGFIRRDADGVPYLVRELIGLDSPVAFDDDGVPYLTIGA